MKRRLLLDSEVIEVLESLAPSVKKSIWRRLREIAEAPDRYEDFQDRDSHGRELSGHIFQKFAIFYWDDLADRHLKILEILRADDLAE